MISNYGLKAKEFADRKVVKESTKNRRWFTVKQAKLKGEEISFINKYHFTPTVLREGYRAAHMIAKAQKWILIDVDEEGSNVEAKLNENGLEYIKAPSASASDTVTHKWHYFVKTKRLSKLPSIAKGQIKHFYETLELENTDNTAVDPARYFAPCGAGEVFGTKKWKKRIKWCDKRTEWIEGKKWKPQNPKKVKPIFGSTGIGVNINVSDLMEVESPKVGETIKVVKMNTEKNSYRLDRTTQIFLGGENKWTTLQAIAEQLDDGESISNLFGCPVRSEDHTYDHKTVGYGYATRKGKITYFNCGGSSCQGFSYYIVDKVFKDEK